MVLRGGRALAVAGGDVGFQYPLVDRVGFEGSFVDDAPWKPRRFQYPLVDRVGFEGYTRILIDAETRSFSILWWIELVLRGHQRHKHPHATPACFSILWWIELVLRDTPSPPNSLSVRAFQYPLVDRVGFEGAPSSGASACGQIRFSILWWIELVLRGGCGSQASSSRLVSVSSGGSSWF